MKTAVEFYAEGLEQLEYNPLEKNGYENAKKRLLEQAKEMEKKEIVNAYLDGTLQFDNAAEIVRPKEPAVYYNETYGGDND